VFVAANTPDEIESLYAHIFDVLQKRVDVIPKEGEHRVRENENRGDIEAAVKVMNDVSKKLNVRFFFTSNLLLRYFLTSAETFAPLSAPFTPDHIVYAGAWPLFLHSTEVRSPEKTENAINRFAQEHGERPKILAVQNIGIFSLGNDEAAAKRASDLFVDAAKIAWDARAFGGVHPMAHTDIDFIRDWEVERYRSSVAAESNAISRR
jgi:rhamnose utilization protein RhaD (predicted bifunctional aldolase and dehydrogenase)